MKDNRLSIIYNDGFIETHFDGIGDCRTLCGHDTSGDSGGDHDGYNEAEKTKRAVDCIHCLDIMKFCKSVRLKKSEKTRTT